MTKDNPPKPIPGTARIIYETFGFFQKSFLRSIKDFGVGTAEQWAEIEANKAERGDVSIDQRQRDYCALECDFLAQMMERFRSNCVSIRTDKLPRGLRPRTWNGAGKLASSLHRAYGTVRGSDLTALLPGGCGIDPAVLDLAQSAYYGGRFEITRTGAIPGPVFEYDINSAYPAAMLRLPCLKHGIWEQASGARLRSCSPDDIWVAPVKFRHAMPGGHANLFGLPVRQHDGKLCWPGQGAGVYWSVEIVAAKRLGCQPSFYRSGGWLYTRTCDCQPFAWVRELYLERKRLGSGAQGYPLKLAINALYGQLARRVGDDPPYANLIWAGLITAITRATLIEASSADPDAIAMLATDGILSRRPLPVSTGGDLGQWGGTVHQDGMFIVMPGVYWGRRPADPDEPRRQKSRGVSASFFNKPGVTERFEAAWAQYAGAARSALKPAGLMAPVVDLYVDLFVGLKLASARGKPETAGKWLRASLGPHGLNDTWPRQLSFDWAGKRGAGRWEAECSLWTYPKMGSSDLVSRPHKSDPGLIEGMDLAQLELDDQPDFVAGEDD